MCGDYEYPKDVRDFAASVKDDAAARGLFPVDVIRELANLTGVTFAPVQAD